MPRQLATGSHCLAAALQELPHLPLAGVQAARSGAGILATAAIRPAAAAQLLDGWAPAGASPGCWACVEAQGHSTVW